VQIDAGALPLAAGLADVARAAGRDPLELAVSGGEDYELLAAIPPELLTANLAGLALDGGEDAESQSATKLARIGEVAAGSGVEIRRPGGGLLAAKGFDQLR
jgi:thiamine-monophosphate kinase